MTGLELFWLPLGAGGHSVRVNGKVYEALLARAQRRASRDLYHAALVAELPDGHPLSRSGPSGTGSPAPPIAARWCRARSACVRWAVAVVPLRGAALAGRSHPGPRVRRGRPASSHRRRGRRTTCPRRRDRRAGADLGPRRARARGDVELQLRHTWVLVRAGLDPSEVQPPSSGRAPGFDAGLAAARREQEAS